MKAGQVRLEGCLSVGSPAVCAYQALLESGKESDGHQQQATQVAHSFMTLFNTVNGSAAIRRMPDRQHWWSMVRYCAEGGLQAVSYSGKEFDFTAHRLQSNPGYASRSATKAGRDLYEAMKGWLRS
jgi:hypothetical protein